MLFFEMQAHVPLVHFDDIFDSTFGVEQDLVELVHQRLFFEEKVVIDD